jgi:hypothetical protein
MNLQGIFACTGTIEIVLVIASVIFSLILIMIVIVILVLVVIVILTVTVIVIVGLVKYSLNCVSIDANDLR